ncbi:hypothetical protein NDU88_007286 [Pleurodeles waltl]|uniref:Uncharacterized protein n=1 Tax=Pleurodeles waltl TaxID=8319 RepID=A0AAV7QMJ2_PLEWA|nr:hypothetical protein NDU88_007286 [Pleurodeles waltl]
MLTLVSTLCLEKKERKAHIYAEPRSFMLILKDSETIAGLQIQAVSLHESTKILDSKACTARVAKQDYLRYRNTSDQLPAQLQNQ